TGIIVLLSYIIWSLPFCLLGGIFKGSVCGGYPWPAWAQVLSIWSIFFVGWLLSLMLGIGSIEVPKRKRMSGTARFFRDISEFGPIQTILTFYGLVALLGIIVMWYSNIIWPTKGFFPPALFALAVIVVFIGHCCDFYRRDPHDRHIRLLVYGLISLAVFIFTLASSNTSRWSLNGIEVVVLATEFGVFVLCLLLFIFRRPPALQ